MVAKNYAPVRSIPKEKGWVFKLLLHDFFIRKDQKHLVKLKEFHQPMDWLDLA
jgi:hypothetical protein